MLDRGCESLPRLGAESMGQKPECLVAPRGMLEREQVAGDLALRDDYSVESRQPHYSFA